MQIIVTYAVFTICTAVLLLALNYLIDFIGWLFTRDWKKKETKD